jgi:hypothetical protein
MSRPRHNDAAAHDDAAADDAPAVREIVSGALTEIGDLSKLMEIAYFSHEPGFFELARWFASLSDDSRRQLVEFVAAAGERPLHIDRPDVTSLVMRLSGR